MNNSATVDDVAANCLIVDILPYRFQGQKKALLLFCVESTVVYLYLVPLNSYFLCLLQGYRRHADNGPFALTCIIMQTNALEVNNVLYVNTQLQAVRRALQLAIATTHVCISKDAFVWSTEYPFSGE